jgi:hypothetical protein
MNNVTALDTTAPAEQHIPRADEIAGLDSSGRDYYSISEGKFVVRREKETIKETDKLVGRLDRIGVEEGAWKSGRNYHRVEVDITTADGPVQLALDLIDPDGIFKPSVAAWQVARAFVAAGFNKGEIIALQAWQGTPQKSHHKPSNCVSTYRVVGNRSDRIVAPSMPDQDWDDLEEALRTLSCYGARPHRDDEESATTGMISLVTELKARGWATPAENESGWLKLVTGRLKMSTVKSLDEIRDDVWGQVAKDIANNAPAGSPPFPEIAAAEPVKISSLFSSATDYDPTADE